MKPKLITTNKKTRSSRGVTDDPCISIIKVKLENRRKPTSPGHERAIHPKTQRPHNRKFHNSIESQNKTPGSWLSLPFFNAPAKINTIHKQIAKLCTMPKQQSTALFILHIERFNLGCTLFKDHSRPNACPSAL
jgi:hypothetical protein